MPRAPVIPPEMTDFSTQICRDDVLKFEKLASKTAVEVMDNWTQVTPLDKLMYTAKMIIKKIEKNTFSS